MIKYRIVKETKNKTKTIKYYIEKYRRFLIWDWWSKLKIYHPLYDMSFILDFNTLKEAQHKLDLLTENTTIEIISYDHED